MGSIARAILLVAGLAAALFVADVDAFAAGGTLYVTDHDIPGAVVPIALPSLTVGSAITSNVGTDVGAVAVSPDAGRAFSADLGGPASVSAIDTTTNAATSVTGAALPSPNAVAVSPDGSTLMVGNTLGNTVAFVNAHTLAVDPTPITVGNWPWSIAFTPNGGFAYVANAMDSTVSVIDMSTKTVVTTITQHVPNDPCDLVVTPNGSKVVVVGGCTSLNGGVAIIDTATNAATAVTSPFGTDIMWAEAMSPSGGVDYVYDKTTGDIWQLDPSTGTVPTNPLVNGAAEIRGLAISPDGSTLYATRQLSGNVSVIPTTTGVPSPTDPVTPKPWADAVTPDQAPHAALSVVAGKAGAASTLSAAGTTTDDGGAASYAWSFGDGGSANTSGPSVSHVYAAKGNYTATVTATDDQGCSTAFVYTGQTASCNGGPAAKATKTFAITSTPPPSPPNTSITKAKIRSRKGKAKFKFKAVPKSAANGFQCQLARKHHKAKRFKSCASPKRYRHLRAGKYTFRVRATGPNGHDATPAKKRFRIKA